MDRNLAGVLTGLVWAVCFAVAVLAWAATTNHKSDNEVRIVQIQTK